MSLFLNAPIPFIAPGVGIIHVGSTYETSFTATAIKTFTVPAGAIAGDLLILSSFVDDGNITVSGHPAGFTEIVNNTNASEYPEGYSYYKIHNGTDTSFTVTWSAPDRTAGVLSVYRTSKPITDITTLSATSQDGAGALNSTISSVSPTVVPADTARLYYYALTGRIATSNIQNPAPTFSPSAGWTHVDGDAATGTDDNMDYAYKFDLPGKSYVSQNVTTTDTGRQGHHLAVLDINTSSIASIAPPPVTDGLVLHIDAGNTSSYPGSGSTATDLTGSGRTMSLVGGVSYQSGTGGRFNFDGSNDYMFTNTSGLSTGTVSFSLEIWCNFDTYQSTRWWLAVIGQYGTGALHWISHGNGGQTAAFGIWGGTQFSPSSSLANTGNWMQIVQTFDGTNSSDIYFNGTKVNTTSTDFSGFNFTNDDFTIGKAQGSESYFDGKVTIARLYNKALTSSEVYTNFRSAKARHGL